MTRRTWKVWCGTVALLAGLAGCSQEQARNVATAIEEKTFTLTPGTASLKMAFLTGQLQALKVTERLEQGTGKVVDPPKLRGTLKLKNASSDRAAQLVSVKIEYLDAEGKPIPLAEGRGDATFKFSSYSTTAERLDPGMEASRDIEVPFPAGALEAKKLRNLRVEVIYIPSAYSEERIDVPVSLGE